MSNWNYSNSREFSDLERLLFFPPVHVHQQCEHGISISVPCEACADAREEENIQYWRDRSAV